MLVMIMASTSSCAVQEDVEAFFISFNQIYENYIEYKIEAKNPDNNCDYSDVDVTLKIIYKVEDFLTEATSEITYEKTHGFGKIKSNKKKQYEEVIYSSDTILSITSAEITKVKNGQCQRKTTLIF